MRQWPPVNGGYSENFASINRGKKSVALDLKRPRRPRFRARARARGRRAGREQPSRRHAAARPRVGLVRAAQARARLLLHLGVRPGRPAIGRRRLRPHHPGRHGRDERDRRGGRRAGEVRRADLGFHRRSLRRVLDRLPHRPRSRRRARAGRIDVPMFATTIADRGPADERISSAPGRTRASSAPRIRETPRTRPTARPTAGSRSRPATTGCGRPCARSWARRSGRPMRASPRRRCARRTRRRSRRCSRRASPARRRADWLARFRAAGVPSRAHQRLCRGARGPAGRAPRARDPRPRFPAGTPRAPSAAPSASTARRST